MGLTSGVFAVAEAEDFALANLAEAGAFGNQLFAQGSDVGGVEYDLWAFAAGR
jgi:hypothetical protein